MTFGLALGPIVIALKVIVCSALIKRPPEGHGVKALGADGQPLEEVDRFTGVTSRLCHALTQVLQEVHPCDVYGPYSDSMANGMKSCVAGRFAYFARLRSAACSAAPPVVEAVRWIYEDAHV